ncbi:MAG: NAD(P)H-dependent oxidoreductase [Methanospirillum sp.]|nr:NAD(P)H-dependent oxidoreductase [Methanospirillum sp.]
MSRIDVAVLVGSLRRGSFNRQLADALPALAPPDFSFHRVEIGDLPLYNQDDDEHQAEPVRRMKREIAEADALLFVTPEYNRSVPGVLKNAIDHASRPHGQNVWAGKPAGVLGVSPGAVGTAVAQGHLRSILAVLDVHVQGQPEAYLQLREGMFDEDGQIGEASRPFLQRWMDGYVEWVTKGMVLREHAAKNGAGPTTT